MGISGPPATANSSHMCHFVRVAFGVDWGIEPGPSDFTHAHLTAKALQTPNPNFPPSWPEAGI